MSKGSPSPQTTPPNTASLAIRQVEQQAVDDILLLLNRLAQQEATTVKLILDRLYDIGTSHLINQKVKRRSLNCITKRIATQTKPIFRSVGVRWFQRHCPQLITNWLYEQVQFQPPSEQSTLEAAVVFQPPSTRDECALELHKLRSQLRWRTRLFIGGLGVLGGIVLISNTAPFLNLKPVSPATAQALHRLD